MEPFSLNRQAAAFLAVIALMTVTMVFLSPFLLLALGGIGVVTLLVVWLKAALRGRSLIAPFGAAEGALALSALFFVIGGATAGGLMFARIGWSDSFSLFQAMLPIGSSPKGPLVGSRMVHYSDADMNERLKLELAKAGIPFTVEKRDGKEYVAWSGEHAAAADEINEKLHQGPASMPAGRTARFPDPTVQKRFTDWLVRNGIKYELVKSRGEEYIVWEEGRPDVVKQYMAERADDCRKKKPSC
jgi:hypothetical protein